jgi:hypothetical protein
MVSVRAGRAGVAGADARAVLQYPDEADVDEEAAFQPFTETASVPEPEPVGPALDREEWDAARFDDDAPLHAAAVSGELASAEAVPGGVPDAEVPAGVALAAEVSGAESVEEPVEQEEMEVELGSDDRGGGTLDEAPAREVDVSLSSGPPDAPDAPARALGDADMMRYLIGDGDDSAAPATTVREEATAFLAEVCRVY